MSKLVESDFMLSERELQELQYEDLIKRKGDKAKRICSNKLSREAQMAMLLALEDTESQQEREKINKVHARDLNSDGMQSSNKSCYSKSISSKETDSLSIITDTDSKTTDSSKSDIERANRKKLRPLTGQTSYSELFERHRSARMDRDITNDAYDEDKEARRALGGGKLESAMEIIEVVNVDNPEAPSWDEDAILELARINSVDKCMVWMEATVGQGDTVVEDTGVAS